jgi:two-component system, LytTR family, sensor kinase
MGWTLRRGDSPRRASLTGFGTRLSKDYEHSLHSPSQIHGPETRHVIRRAEGARARLRSGRIPLAAEGRKAIANDECPQHRDQGSEMSDGVATALRMPSPMHLDSTASEADSRSMQSNRDVIRPRVIFAVATALGFFSGFQAYSFVSTFTERPASFPLLLALNLSYWYSWAVLTPGILWLSSRFPLGQRTWSSSIPVHLVGVFAATLGHVVMTVTLQRVINSFLAETSGTWESQFQRMFLLNFDWEMMTYWAIIGLNHSLRFHHVAKDRALRASQLETRLVEAQLQALQRQLQPHFLFNTLHTISALMHRDVEAADTMIARLSDLLRISLQNVGIQEVTLKQELDFLEKYLEIEQTRFRDRLTVSFDVEPDTLDALVPNLILQPLVENSLKHGIGPRPTPGHVRIRSTRAGGFLELEVCDNGVGMSAARLSDFNRGVGLTNTRSRLQHLYGSHHRFEFRQPSDGGLSVVIAIPLVEPAVEAADTMVEVVA